MSNNQLRNWDGYSRRGQAAYDQQFKPLAIKATQLTHF